MRHRRRAARGFTLIELMVSLIAGLFVALAVVALSSAATNTFHEEAHTAAAEMSLRTAAERLRADLQRAGYMSTANFQKDPFIARAPGQPPPTTGPYPGLYRLASIHLLYQGSAPNVPLSTAAGLSPDAIELSGNFTSTDDYVVRYLENGTGSCAGQRLWLAVDSPAMWRVLSSPNPSAMLEAMFQPVAGSQFIVRVADNTGHYQYVPTCAGQAAGISGTGLAATAWVDLDTSNGIQVLNAQQTQLVGGASGLGVGTLRVNPVQTVRWELRPIDTTKAGDTVYSALAGGDAGTGDKYELFRTYVDAAGVTTTQAELVAEYAIDLKFAFSADLTLPGTQPHTLTVYGLSDPNNKIVADDVTNLAGMEAPQRLRSVRFRLATRSSTPDRAEAVDIPQANIQQGVYPARYCVLSSCTTGQNGWARVRAVTSEVALPNLASYFY